MFPLVEAGKFFYEDLLSWSKTLFSISCFVCYVWFFLSSWTSSRFWSDYDFVKLAELNTPELFFLSIEPFSLVLICYELDLGLSSVLTFSFNFCGSSCRANFVLVACDTFCVLLRFPPAYFYLPLLPLLPIFCIAYTFFLSYFCFWVGGNSGCVLFCVCWPPSGCVIRIGFKI